jgi:hypothetical protein
VATCHPVPQFGSELKHRITGSSLVLTIIFLNFYKIFFVVSRKHKHCFLKVLKMSKRKAPEIKSYFLPGPGSSQSTLSSQQSLSSSSSLGRSSYSSSTMSSSSSLSRSRAFSQGLPDADAIEKERLLINYIKNAPTRHLPFRCQHFYLFGFLVFCF